VGFALTGAGQGLVNPPVTDAGVSGMPPAQAGVAGAVISSTRQFGNVLGVAVMGAMLASGLAGAAPSGPARDDAFAAATHAPWLLAVACGVLTAIAGWIAASPKARQTALAVAGSD